MLLRMPKTAKLMYGCWWLIKGMWLFENTWVLLTYLPFTTYKNYNKATNSLHFLHMVAIDGNKANSTCTIVIYVTSMYFTDCLSAAIATDFSYFWITFLSDLQFILFCMPYRLPFRSVL